jgi:hypothetical protein
VLWPARAADYERDVHSVTKRLLTIMLLGEAEDLVGTATAVVPCSLAKWRSAALASSYSGFRPMPCVRHWTVLRRVGKHSLELFDSSGMERVKLASCRLKYEWAHNGSREYILRRRRVLLISADGAV